MAQPARHKEPARDAEVVRQVRARRAFRWRTRARFPAQRLLECLQGRCVPAPQFEECRKRVETLRGLLARAGIPPDAADVDGQISDRRRPDLLPVLQEIQQTLHALLARARPLSPGSYLQDGQDAR
jgi:hypothetical protein